MPPLAPVTVLTTSYAGRPVQPSVVYQHHGYLGGTVSAATNAGLRTVSNVLPIKFQEVCRRSLLHCGMSALSVLAVCWVTHLLPLCIS